MTTIANLSVIGINHVKTPITLREKFIPNDQEKVSILQEVQNIVAEAVFLCTCNRTEIIYCFEQEKAHSKIQNVLAALGSIPPKEFTKTSYIYSGKQALHHVFRVASGVDSLIPGETQILGQIKSAFTFSSKHGFSKNSLHQIYQKTLHTAKVVRRETALGRGTVSLGSVAVELAHNIFEAIDDKVVVILGAGKMSHLVGGCLARSGVKEIHIVNRTMERARELAEKYGGIGHALEELPSLLCRTDILITSITAERCIITSDMVQRARSTQKGCPLFILDIAVPRNVDPAVNALSETYLYNLDDIQELVQKNMQERYQEVRKAEDIIRQKVEEFWRYNGKLAGETIQQLRHQVSSIKEEELTRLFRKNAHFSAEDKTKIKQSVNLIVNKILHDPILSLREGMQRKPENSSRCIRHFKDFFNL